MYGILSLLIGIIDVQQKMQTLWLLVYVNFILFVYLHCFLAITSSIISPSKTTNELKCLMR